MELYTLNINVNKQRLSFGENKPEIFSGDQSIDFVEFTFEDDMWNFPDIWAIFSRQKGTSYQVSLEDNKVMIPAEVMQKRGYVYIGLMATDGENVQTSSVLQYSIGQGSTNVDAITPSASIYEQFLADLDAYQTAVSELASIEARITTAESSVANLEGRVTTAEASVDSMESDVASLQSAISTAQSNITALQTDVTNLQTSVTALESAVPTLQRDVSALQTGVTNLESRLTAVSTSVSGLEDRLATAQANMTDLEDGLTDAEGRLTTIGNQITDAQTDIEEIETAIQQNNIVTDVTAEGISLVDNHIADLSFMCVTDIASGDVASFPDGSGVAMKKAEVSLEPIQDLHGQSNPYPAGGGKNQYNTADTAWTEGVLDDDGQPVSTAASHYTTNYTKVKSGTAYILSGSISAPNVQVRIYFYTGGKEWISRTSGTSATTCTFTTPATCEYIRIQCGTPITATTDWQVEEGSSATPYAPYENICPIDGYEDVGVSVRGVNMWDEEWEVGLLDASTGLPTTSSQYIRSKNFCECVPNTAYYAQITSPYLIRVFCYDADQNFIEALSAVGRGTFTTSANAHYFKIETWSSAYGTTYNNDISINYPSTDHDYHVYAGTDYTIDLGRTVYGGTIDLVSGRLVVDMAYVDLGTLTWSTPTASGRMSASAGAMPITSSTDLYNVISDTYATITARSWYNATATGISICGAGYGVNGNIGISDPNLVGKTSAEAKSYVTGIHAVYPLETPQTYQLTPQQIQTLIGTNNVWSEDGAIEVEYIANLKDYIDKKINA